MPTDFSTADLARALDRASDDIKREVGALIPAAAQSLDDTVTAIYPLGKTGRLKRGTLVRSLPSTDPLIPVRRVTGAPLAFIWQDGTVVRHDATRKNANRGRMPAGNPHLFERTAAQTRAAMLAHAQAILDRPRGIA
jgi:hypothetical protein